MPRIFSKDSGVRGVAVKTRFTSARMSTTWRLSLEMRAPSSSLAASELHHSEPSNMGVDLALQLMTLMIVSRDTSR